MVTVDFPKLNLKANDVVLDAGCGMGRHLRFLAKYPSLKIVGIDKNTGALREALTSLENMAGRIIWFPKQISIGFRLPTHHLIV